MPHTTLNRTITDLEMNTQYQVQVRATNEEGGSPWSPPGSGRTNVTGNDPPVFPSAPPALEFYESEGNERKKVMGIGQPVTANDPGDTLTYSLEGVDAGSFTIDSSTGQIKTRSRVYDYEAEVPDYSYSVVVKATDSHGISDTIALTIRVLNKLERPPRACRAVGVGLLDQEAVGKLAPAHQQHGPAGHRQVRPAVPVVPGRAVPFKSGRHGLDQWSAGRNRHERRHPGTERGYALPGTGAGGE